jgi:hypothetical protein
MTIRLRPIPPAYSWRPWIKDILAAASLIAFIFIFMWGLGQIANLLKALGWVD